MKRSTVDLSISTNVSLVGSPHKSKTFWVSNIDGRVRFRKSENRLLERASGTEREKGLQEKGVKQHSKEFYNLRSSPWVGEKKKPKMLWLRLAHSLEVRRANKIVVENLRREGEKVFAGTKCTAVLCVCG
jgi:hypothetical protein